MAEFAGNYGFLPRHDDPWALFLSLVESSGRFWSRQQLVMFDAVADGVSSLFAGDTSISESIRSDLESLAWPTSKKRGGPKVIQNALANQPPKGEPSA